MYQTTLRYWFYVLFDTTSKGTVAGIFFVLFLKEPNNGHLTSSFSCSTVPVPVTLNRFSVFLLFSSLNEGPKVKKVRLKQIKNNYLLHPVGSSDWSWKSLCKKFIFSYGLDRKFWLKFYKKRFLWTTNLWTSQKFLNCGLKVLAFGFFHKFLISHKIYKIVKWNPNFIYKNIRILTVFSKLLVFKFSFNLIVIWRRNQFRRLVPFLNHIQFHLKEGSSLSTWIW